MPARELTPRSPPPVPPWKTSWRRPSPGPRPDALEDRTGEQTAADHEDPGVVERVDGRRSGGGAEDGHQAGHAERDADLAGHGVERGPGGEALRRQRRRGGAAERRQHEADAEAAEQAAGEIVAHPVRRGADVPPPQTAGGEAQGAAVPTMRWPRRAPSTPPGKAVSPASSGPGAIMNPARRTDSCQTPVRNSTPPRTRAPKPLKKASELTSASATARCRTTAGSMTGLG